MAANHLEQLVAEWLEYTGYFVRRNAKVGRRIKGGYDGESDIVAFNPITQRLVHYEPSTDTYSWPERERRYRKKFDAGRKHIPSLFHGITVPTTIEQYAVFLYGSKSTQREIGGGKVLMIDALLKEMTDLLSTKRIGNEIVPEQFPLLRVLQLTCEFRKKLFG